MRDIWPKADCYVTSRKWEEEIQEKRSQGKEEAKVVVCSFTNSPLQRGVEITDGNKVIENGETRPNGGVG